MKNSYKETVGLKFLQKNEINRLTKSSEDKFVNLNVNQLSVWLIIYLSSPSLKRTRDDAR